MGEATATILTELGAEVIGLDVKEIAAPVVRAMHLDLRDQSSIEGVVKSIDAPVAALFSCAGLPGPPFSELDTVLVNILGPRHLAELLVPKMPAGSAIGAISSSGAIGWQENLPTLLEFLRVDGFAAGLAWLESHPDAWSLSGYGFSKQAMNAWVGYWCADIANVGIRVNCINPGPTDTAMMPAFHALVGKDLVDSALGPVGRYSTAGEQAWPLVMLNSPHMSYVTGEVLWTDGGFLGALTTGRLEAEWAQGMAGE
jgi:NAD(P)-dependent dehydrogenase (short-subunit alcohol dehydrogenase family)